MYCRHYSTIPFYFISLRRIYFLLSKSVAPAERLQFFTDRPTTPPLSHPLQPNNKNCPSGKAPIGLFSKINKKLFSEREKFSDAHPTILFIRGTNYTLFFLSPDGRQHNETVKIEIGDSGKQREQFGPDKQPQGLTSKLRKRNNQFFHHCPPDSHDRLQNLSLAICSSNCNECKAFDQGLLTGSGHSVQLQDASEFATCVHASGPRDDLLIQSQ